MSSALLIDEFKSVHRCMSGLVRVRLHNVWSVVGHTCYC